MAKTVLKAGYSISLRPFYFAKGLALLQSISKAGEVAKGIHYRRNVTSNYLLGLNSAIQNAVLPSAKIVKYSDATYIMRT
jgi:hypothetical protein